MVVTETQGVWARARTVMLPVGASTSRSAQNADLDSVECVRVGDCEAFGSYVDARKQTDGMVVTETRGVWGRASRFELAPGVDIPRHSGALSLASVSCGVRGNCEGVLRYFGAGGANDSAIAVETHGVWDGIQEIRLPIGVKASAYNEYAQPRSLSCTSQGNCVAVGEDVVGGIYAPVVATETRGAWARARPLALPINNATHSSTRGAILRSVACTKPGSCVAVGDDADDQTGAHILVASEVDGTWERAQAVRLPPNATMPNKGRYPALEMVAIPFAVACASSGNCVAVGVYGASNDTSQALIVTEANGHWARAGELMPPNNANRTPAGPVAFMDALACSGGRYVAVGTYTDTKNGFQAMIDSSPAEGQG
jgi:hypothetical protein